jgi:lipid-binding SYLF domain-containing protein
MNSLPRSLFIACLLYSTSQPCVTMGQTIMDQTVDSATSVLDEIMSVPAKQIPQYLLADAHGVAIIPNVVKGGFVVGVRHGRGVALVRDEAGRWNPPIFVTLTGGSVGWQAGIQSTDVVLIFRTRQSIDGLMAGKLTIGVDAAAAAGPVGRQAAAATDARLAAEILSYSRSRGLFAGVSIDGSLMQLDHPAGSAYYHTPIVGANGEAIRPLESAPPSAIRLMNRLAQYSGSPPIAVPDLSHGPAASELPQAELVRHQLVSSWQELSAILDGRWREYLEPPREVLAGQRVDATTLRNKLQHYATVASDQQYAALAQSPEFAATYQLFREYVTLQASQSATKLTLPPPPSRRY